MNPATQASYEAWRISYQSSEQAARAAWLEVQRLRVERDGYKNAAEIEAGLADHFSERVRHLTNELATLRDDPEGFVMVPVKSTNEMHKAYLDAKYDGPKPTLIPDLWAAMLAARPQGEK